MAEIQTSEEKDKELMKEIKEEQTSFKEWKQKNSLDLDKWIMGTGSAILIFTGSYITSSGFASSLMHSDWMYISWILFGLSIISCLSSYMIINSLAQKGYDHTSLGIFLANKIIKKEVSEKDRELGKELKVFPKYQQTWAIFLDRLMLLSFISCVFAIILFITFLVITVEGIKEQKINSSIYGSIN